MSTSLPRDIPSVDGKAQFFVVCNETEASNLYLHVDLDSSGMSVYWGRRETAELFSSKQEAKDFLARLEAHFPDVSFSVIPL